MFRDTRGAPAPQSHSKSAPVDREASILRLAAKGFGVLRNNADGSTDFYRLLSIASAPAGLYAWYRLGDGDSDDELYGVPVIGFAAVLISYGGSRFFQPSIESVVLVEGAVELACQACDHLGVTRTEDEMRAAVGMPPRSGRQS